MSNTLELLNWRYATKKMKPDAIVPTEKLDIILESIRLSASSSGLQPYQVLVVTDDALKAQIRKVAWDQSQVTDCSHLLVFAAWDNYTPERINMMFDLVNEQRGFKNEGWEAYRQKLLAYYPQRPAEQNFEHAARQAYIGLGSALIAAAEQEVDSTPMEGFEPEHVDRILGLGELGLKSVILLPLGYREAGADWLVDLKKVRRDSADFLINR
ncbi:NAD(P)H-dependent oxidoreductase [Alishewanella sp. SMS8]|uniref:NAD(P)H-dependent oxidoreductase n=1 Tax=Alishewanella sp. SMS8 TaxID=2994676 RepID=UPI0027416207|nr:NAD(P)H-dependent oxidoreductase [Alishewanella sp. SMS8]MDP5206415.1 NAD(P)H-dependent oxidoreductase [Alishewanella sp. SMS9]MDP5459145.1 NAD(P)H-dependent oxidoreductase [Alishewanella sp. SMS8]